MCVEESGEREGEREGGVRDIVKQEKVKRMKVTFLFSGKGHHWKSSSSKTLSLTAAFTLHVKPYACGICRYVCTHYGNSSNVVAMCSVDGMGSTEWIMSYYSGEMIQSYPLYKTSQIHNTTHH